MQEEKQLSISAKNMLVDYVMYVPIQSMAKVLNNTIKKMYGPDGQHSVFIFGSLLLLCANFVN